MKRFVFSLLLITSFSILSAQTLTLKWKTDTLLRVPESVLLDSKNNVLYVSNINGAPDDKDGNGFISKLSKDGKILNLKWATGLSAPKGMGIYQNNLYVTDITNVAVIDMATGKVKNTFEVEGAQFLNDITIDDKGTVFISDSGTGKIHSLVGEKVQDYFEDKTIEGTNGLYASKGSLYAVSFKTGAFYKISADKKLTKIAETGAGGDGISPTGKNEFLISSWHGEIYYVDAAGKAQKLLDTKDQKLSSADIDFDSKTSTLFIPTFFTNTVMAYTFKK